MLDQQTQLELQALVDDELSPPETARLTALCSSNPEAQRFVSDLRCIKTLLVENEPMASIPCPESAYWRGIEKQISASSPATGVYRTFLSKIPRFTYWAAGAAAACAALVLTVVRPLNHPGTLSRELVEIESPDPSMSTVTFRNDEQKLTVVWLSERTTKSTQDLWDFED